MSERLYTLALFDVFELKWRAFLTIPDRDRLQGYLDYLVLLTPVPCCIVEPPGSTDDEIGDFVEALPMPFPDSLAELYGKVYSQLREVERVWKQAQSSLFDIQELLH